MLKLNSREDVKLSIIIPVYNEVKTFDQLLQKVQALPLNKEIIIVDDGSSDGTRGQLQKYRQPNVKILLHDHNQGKGAAIKTGLAQASGEVVVIQDADLEYDPAEIPALVGPIIEDKYDVVYGSRFLGQHEKKYFNLLYLGNRFFSLLTAILFLRPITDMETCYKAFRTKILKSFIIRSDRFDFEPEITAKVLKSGCRFVELPIGYRSRSYAEGKKIGWRDGVAAIWTLLRYRFYD